MAWSMNHQATNVLSVLKGNINTRAQIICRGKIFVIPNLLRARFDPVIRHVRVNHVDKDTNDPQLREVLAQRCEGGNRGRRRRLGI